MLSLLLKTIKVIRLSTKKFQPYNVQQPSLHWCTFPHHQSPSFTRNLPSALSAAWRNFSYFSLSSFMWFAYCYCNNLHIVLCRSLYFLSSHLYSVILFSYHHHSVPFSSLTVFHCYLWKASYHDPTIGPSVSHLFYQLGQVFNARSTKMGLSSFFAIKWTIRATP